jgi:hypothetical protein
MFKNKRAIRCKEFCLDCGKILGWVKVIQHREPEPKLELACIWCGKPIKITQKFCNIKCYAKAVRHYNQTSFHV